MSVRGSMSKRSLPSSQTEYSLCTARASVRAIVREIKGNHEGNQGKSRAIKGP